MGRPGFLPEYACQWAHHSRRELPDVGNGADKLHGITIVRMDRDEGRPTAATARAAMYPALVGARPIRGCR